jgi:hypothetical protein
MINKPTGVIWADDTFIFGQPIGIKTIKKNGKKALFLHGLFTNKSFKVTNMLWAGYDVEEPNLSGWFFNSALKTAQDAFDKYKPDVIVGSSRGGALAMAMNHKDTPMILMAPAWKLYGCEPKVSSKCAILHSPEDAVVSYKDSVELSRFTKAELCATGNSHRLNDTQTTNLMLDIMDELCGLVDYPL